MEIPFNSEKMPPDSLKPAADHESGSCGSEAACEVSEWPESIGMAPPIDD